MKEKEEDGEEEESGTRKRKKTKQEKEEKKREQVKGKKNMFVKLKMYNWGKLMHKNDKKIKYTFLPIAP